MSGRPNAGWSRVVTTVIAGQLSQVAVDGGLSLTSNRGRVAKISVEDADLAQYYWGYGVLEYPRGKLGKLHRIVAERCFGPIPKGMYVDHIDGSPLNNRRQNLRVVTPSQSLMNTNTQKCNKTGYRGVFKHREKWRASIWSGCERLSLGGYDTKEDAAMAYDCAARHYHGEYAKLNFPQQ